MLIQECDQIPQLNVALLTTAEVGHEQMKRQFPAVMLFERLAEDDGVDGGESGVLLAQPGEARAGARQPRTC